MSKLVGATIEVKESELVGLIPDSSLDITSIAAAFTDGTQSDSQANVTVAASASPIPDEAIFALFGDLLPDADFNLTSAKAVIDDDGDEAVQFVVVST